MQYKGKRAPTLGKIHNAFPSRRRREIDEKLPNLPIKSKGAEDSFKIT